MSSEPDVPLAFEDDVLDATVREVMAAAKALGQTRKVIPGTTRWCDLLDAQSVRNFLIEVSKAEYRLSGQSAASHLRAPVYQDIWLSFEALLPNEAPTVQYEDSGMPPVHVAQFWKRIARDNTRSEGTAR